jgi:transcriptional regulator GlxA family with amidase domain
MRADYSFLSPSKPPPELVRPLRIGIAPTPDFTLMSLAGFVEFLRLSSDESDFSRQIYCSWDLLSHDDQPIRSSCGFPMVPTRMFPADPAEYDYIVVHGGLLHSKARVPDALYEFVRLTAIKNVPIIGLCTGQFVLAELGLLAGRRCAVHFSLVLALRQNFPDIVAVTDGAFVRDGNFISCPGGLASINLAMHLVSEHCGKSRSHKALHYLMADRGFDEIKATHEDDIGLKCLDGRVVNAVGLMRQNLYELSSVANIALNVGASERELARLFRKHLRVSPAEYWRQLRLKAARWMVINSDRSMTQIAYECGFSDSAHMIHWFKRSYSVTPARLRRMHSEFGIH